MPGEFEFFPDAPWKRRRAGEQSGARVLATLSERGVARLVEVSLARQGYWVEVVPTADAAATAVAARLPDAVVLDADVPGADGVLDILRRQPGGAEVQVIVIAGRDWRDEVRKGWASGATAVLAKPLNPMELVAFVRRACETRTDEAHGIWHERFPV